MRGRTLGMKSRGPAKQVHDLENPSIITQQIPNVKYTKHEALSSPLPLPLTISLDLSFTSARRAVLKKYRKFSRKLSGGSRKPKVFN